MESLQFKPAKEFAEKYGIKYATDVSWTDLKTIVYYGTTQDFFTNKKASKFRYLYGANRFNRRHKSAITIGISIPSPVDGPIGRYSVEYRVNQSPVSQDGEPIRWIEN